MKISIIVSQYTGIVEFTAELDLGSPLKKSQQRTMRVKIFVRQSHNSLILR